MKTQNKPTNARKKDEAVLDIFYNEPTKHWHFEEILKHANISRPQASKWLTKFQKDSLIQRIKEKGKMPYYISNWEHPNYQVKKRLYALQILERAGFLQHLASLPKAKTVIIFGSIVRGDWYTESDVDVFIYGDDNGYNYAHYWKALNREIQTFVCRTTKDIMKFAPGLLPNILKGYLVKGNWDFAEVRLNA